MSSTYNGDPSHITIGSAVSITIPDDGDAASAASVNNPGPFDYTADFLEYMRQHAGRTNAANTWASAQTFSSGITVSSGGATITGNSFITGHLNLTDFVSSPVGFLTTGTGTLDIAGDSELHGQLIVLGLLTFTQCALHTVGGGGGDQAFESGYSNGPSGSQKLVYWKGADGSIHCQGTFTGPSGTSMVPVILPSGFRPAGVVIGTVDSGGQPGVVTVAANGTVTALLAGTNTVAYIDVSFRPDAGVN